MHCISLAILSQLSRFPSPAVSTNWPFCVDESLNNQSIDQLLHKYLFMQMTEVRLLVQTSLTEAASSYSYIFILISYSIHGVITIIVQLMTVQILSSDLQQRKRANVHMQYQIDIVCAHQRLAKSQTKVSHLGLVSGVEDLGLCLVVRSQVYRSCLFGSTAYTAQWLFLKIRSSFNRCQYVNLGHAKRLSHSNITLIVILLNRVEIIR